MTISGVIDVETTAGLFDSASSSLLLAGQSTKLSEPKRGVATIMVEAGRTCACTPRSLLVPAGGVTTLDPSQRVSAKDLDARDREWRRQSQQAQHAGGSRLESKDTSSEVTLRDDAASTQTEAKVRKSLITRVFGGKDDKSDSTKR